MNKLIAVVGMSGTGKSVITDYLEENNWNKLYFGGITYKLMKEAGIERTADGKVEKEFREKLNQGNVVLDGLYSWYEYKYLIERFENLVLICVVTDKNIRYSRVANRPDRPFDKEAIVYRDLSEIENLAKGGPIAYADYYILNNGEMDEEINRLKEILKEIGE